MIDVLAAAVKRLKEEQSAKAGELSNWSQWSRR